MFSSHHMVSSHRGLFWAPCGVVRTRDWIRAGRCPAPPCGRILAWQHVGVLGGVDEAEHEPVDLWWRCGARLNASPEYPLALVSEGNSWSRAMNCSSPTGRGKLGLGETSTVNTPLTWMWVMESMRRPLL